MTSATSDAVYGSNLRQGPTAAHPTYRLIQVLRAVAALMVVVHHSTIMLHDRDHFVAGNWVNGGAGVDIFFVISGFVMTVSSVPLRTAAHPATTFLARRLERIVPLYWLMTTLKVVTVLAAPAFALNALGTPWHVIASYFFLPSVAAGGNIEPVLVVGWTLNFEMMFYGLFAVALATRANLLKLLAPVLLLLTLFRFVPQPGLRVASSFYENSMLLEFLAGIVLAYALSSIRKMPALAAVVLAIFGFGLLGLWTWPNFTGWRGVAWGLPATAIVCAALALEARFGGRTPRWILELGDASYSIYLVHGFALPAVGILIAHLHTTSSQVFPFALVVTVVLSTACGELVYRCVERPITLWFRGRRRTAIPANP